LNIRILSIKVLTMVGFITACAPTDKEDANPDTTTDGQSDIQIIADEFLRESSHPGVVVAIAAIDNPLQIAAAGKRKLGDSTELTINDKMHLGSCTKAMTATVVARLVEKGTLLFTSTVAEILPSLTPHIHPMYQDVTIEQLLTHQSGMPANPQDWWIDHGDPVSDIRWKIARTALDASPAFTPGTNTLYSNLGYMIAGLMIEKVSQATWEEIIADEVFQPMGLSSAGFGPPSTGGSINQPWGHALNDNGDLEPSQFDNAPPLGPAGRVHMNFSDWSKFILAHTTDGQSLDDQEYLSSSSWKKLHSPLRDNYSPGWVVVNRSWAQGDTYTHSGSNTFWYSVVWAAPELNRAYLVGTNTATVDTASHMDNAVVKLLGMGLLLKFSYRRFLTTNCYMLALIVSEY